MITLCWAGSVAVATDPPRPATIEAPPLPIATPVSLPKPGRPVDIPPLGLPSLSPTLQIPSGTVVSTPLQPTLESTKSPLSPMTASWETSKPITDFWANAEYVSWWPKAPFVPPLVVSSRVGTPRLGGPNTSVLVDQSSADSLAAGGARFSWGFSINEDRTLGVAASYHFQTASEQQILSSSASRTLARPVMDLVTGMESSFPISMPTSEPGYTLTALSTRTMGWELMGVMNVVDGPQARIHALAGYRYFQLHEGLRFSQTSQLDDGFVTHWGDEFRTENHFHGGLLGLTADIVQGSFFLEMTGKFSFGQVGHRVRVSGETVATTPNMMPITTPVGILAQPTNIGTTSRNTFAFLPEGMFKLGYRFAGESRVYVGYNVIYMSDAMRPGEQIDRSVGVFSSSAFQATSMMPTDRPALTYLRSDFWLQGLVLGFEYRY
ncbi:MAG: BBP7 family outer membrane beta-barrel protein [Fimbriiglobus sp.]